MNFKEAYPHLMKYWDHEKNELSPEEVHYGSRVQEVYLKCENNHSFKKNPVSYKRSKSKKINCPKCKEEKENRNELFKDKCFEIIKYWDYEKNKNININKLKINFNKNCYFKCKKNHEVIKKPSNLSKMISPKINCNICSGKKVIKETKLENAYPEIAKEYCKIKNKIDLSEVSCYSNEKVWWLCEENHYWKNSVSSRTGNRYKYKGKTNCPYCWSNSHSRNEIIIYSEIKQFFKDAILGEKLKRKEMDIFIKNLNLAIEYDGNNWHKNIKKDKEKNKLLKEKNIKLIRIREYPLKKIEKDDLIYNLKESLFNPIVYILNFIIKNYELSENLKSKIKNYIKAEKITNEKLFQKIKDKYKIKKIINKKIIEDYHKEKNSLPINYYGVGSQYNAFWKCSDCGFEYQKVINKKIKYPECGNCKKQRKNIFNKKEKKINKIKYTHPEILIELPKNEIDKLINLTQTNSRVYFNSTCSNCNNEFKTNMYNKIKKKQRCPKCNFSIFVKKSDLLKKHRYLIEKHDDNNEIDLRYVDENFPKKQIWKCNKGHLTKKSIKDYIKYQECYECIKTETVDKIPSILEHWDYEENNKLKITPENIKLSTKKKVYFKCNKNKDHKWFVYIGAHKKGGCPYCGNKRLSITNKLTITHPEIAELWSSNNKTLPDMYTVGNAKEKFLWNCKHCSEEFSKEIKQMERTKGFCPNCKKYNI